ncbi:MAG: hypothetical protein ACR2MO_02075 [Acidimicrobiales bacterium]
MQAVFEQYVTIWRSLSELEAASLVCRESNPDDRRSTYAAITAAGRARLRRAAPTYLAAIRRHFVAALDPEHVQVVQAAMSAVVARADPDHPSPTEAADPA